MLSSAPQLENAPLSDARQRRQYAPETQRQGSEKPPKKKVGAISTIAEHPRFAEATTILRTLESGYAAIEGEVDALRIEGYLARQPKGQRAEVLRNRLKGHRAVNPDKHAPAPIPKDLAPTVAAAMELLNAGVRPVRRDRKALIAQLEEDRDLLARAVREQQGVVDGLRDELSAQAAERLKAQHRELVLAQFRAAQQFAAATDALKELQRFVVVEGGYLWRADLLPAPSSRGALVLGSEIDFDSDVSRMRRLLEELTIL
jgi:hypothetical protein